MSTEIERKFLVDPSKLPVAYTSWPYAMIEQGYIQDRGSMYVVAYSDMNVAHLIVQDNGLVSRKSYTYKIPLEDAEGLNEVLQNDPTMRIRLKEAWPGSGVKQAFITIKGPGTLERPEYEYSISYNDGLLLMSSVCSTFLNKRRYQFEGWELDEFLGDYSGLWLAEIKLPHRDATFTKPGWVCEEVTEDPHYTNSSLAEKGAWPHAAAWARLYVSGFPENNYLTDYLPVRVAGFWQAQIHVQQNMPQQPDSIAFYDIFRRPVAYRIMAGLPSNNCLVKFKYLPELKTISVTDYEAI